MQGTDIDQAVSLIGESMNEQEALWSRDTFDYYFAMQKARIDSGRDYYVWRFDNAVCGLVGLHRYLWGPRENVWLSWFAVKPSLQGRGVGTSLLNAAQDKARERGFTKMLIETYEGPDFACARAFYENRGFAKTGEIRDYLPSGESMVVFSRGL